MQSPPPPATLQLKNTKKSTVPSYQKKCCWYFYSIPLIICFYHGHHFIKAYNTIWWSEKSSEEICLTVLNGIYYVTIPIPIDLIRKKIIIQYFNFTKMHLLTRLDKLIWSSLRCTTLIREQAINSNLPIFLRLMSFYPISSLESSIIWPDLQLNLMRKWTIDLKIIMESLQKVKKQISIRMNRLQNKNKWNKNWTNMLKEF